MANAKRDGNYKPTITGVSASDGTTILNVYADANLHAILVDDAGTGSDLGPVNSAHDQNHVATWSAVSNSDGITIVPLYVKASNNALLTKSS